jgi:hypothetical protein
VKLRETKKLGMHKKLRKTEKWRRNLEKHRKGKNREEKKKLIQNTKYNEKYRK